MLPRYSLAMLLCAVTSPAQDPVAGKAFVEIVTPRDAFYVHERIELAVRFGFELQFHRDNLIELFRQKLDLQAQLRATWLQQLEGAFTPEREGSDSGTSFALNDATSRARRLEDTDRDGARFAVFEIDHVLFAERPGELALPTVELRFAYATEFDTDFLGGRVPRNRRDVTVSSNAVRLGISTAPAIGQPSSFTGGIGSFSVGAAATPNALDANTSTKLTLTIEGDGNLHDVGAPALDGLAGFRVLGVLEERNAQRCSITYDLAAIDASITAIPAIEFSFFDPAERTYRQIYTQPIPITVRANSSTAPRPLEPIRAIPGETDIYGIRDRSSGGGTGISSASLVLALLGPWLIALLLRSWLREHERRLADPAGERARRALRRFRRSAQSRQGRQSDEFAEYLAARLRTRTPAVVGPDLIARLQRAHIPIEVARRASDTLEQLIGQRYGGVSKQMSEPELNALVSELEHWFVRASRA